MTTEEQIYVCALRYGLGRMTYITSVISDFIQTKELSEHCKKVMITSIEECDNYGWDCDKKSWMKLLNYLKK